MKDLLLFSLLILALLPLSFPGSAKGVTNSPLTSSPQLPDAIAYYVPINIANTQSVATASPFQLGLKVDSSQFGQYEASSLQNVEFFKTDGTIVPSWLESGNSNRATDTIYWLSLSGGIAPLSSTTIYMGFVPPGMNLFGSGSTGESPLLSGAYAQFDNGQNVFSFYDNFAGTTLSSSWTSSGMVTVSDGLNIPSGTTDSYVKTGQLFSALDNILEVNWFATQAPKGALDFGFNSLATSAMNALFWKAFPDQQAITATSTYTIIKSGLTNSGNQIYGVGSLSGTAFAFVGDVNPTIYQTTNNVFTGQGNIDLENNFGQATGASLQAQWVRVRSSPPNGVPPTVTIGSVNSALSVSASVAQPSIDAAEQQASFSCLGTRGFPPYSYSWTFGDGATGAGASIDHLYTSTGTMNVQCVATDNLGTTANAVTHITVSPPLLIELPVAQPSTIDAGQGVSITTTATGGSGSYHYAWSGLPQGCLSANSATISCNPVQQGSYQIAASVTDSNSETVSSGSIQFVAYPDLAASFTSSPSKIDLGQSLNLIASASGGFGTFSYTYSGLPQGCSTSNAAVITCVPSVTGSYNVQLQVTDSNGFSVTKTSQVVVDADPSISSFVISSSTIDVGQSTMFSVSITAGIGPFTYTYIGLPLGCMSSNTATVSCTASTSGSYQVTAEITDSTGFSTSKASLLVVNEDPSIDSFSVSSPRINQGQSVTLTASARDGTTPLTYSYTGLPPGCESSNSPQITCTPSNSGIYSITITITDQNGKASSMSVDLTVAPTQFLGLGYTVVGGVGAIVVVAIAGVGVFLRGRINRAPPRNQQYPLNSQSTV